MILATSMILSTIGAAALMIGVKVHFARIDRANARRAALRARLGFGS